MTQKMQIYKCEICGNIVEMLHEGEGELVCCGAPMKHYQEKTNDVAKEKHVPVIEKIENGYRIKVGTVAHPMEDKHYIEWIEVSTDDGRVYRRFLAPGNAPEAVFAIDASRVTARVYCNIHGLWKD